MSLKIEFKNSLDEYDQLAILPLIIFDTDLKRVTFSLFAWSLEITFS